MSTVDAPSLACSFRAIANPTTPPPITACVKSAFLLTLDEKGREMGVRDMAWGNARKENMITNANK